MIRSADARLEVTSSVVDEARDGFRADINGLRAWAVMAVVLYHFGVYGIGGGFVGVDVFFVISGYLMCSLILGGIERGDFSVWRFYLARARRIWPALIALSLVLLVLGWFFLMPEEYQRLGKHVRESLLFASNIGYFDEAGYFDVASQEKWLLHSWSLSVEWQFYLAFPLLLILLARLGVRGRYLTWGVGGLLLLGYLLSVWRTSVNANEAFYLLHARAWEMLAGAFVYQLQQDMRLSAGWRRALELLGFGLIVTAVLGFDKHSVWPGWLAAVPVLGGALVLLAGRQGSLWTGLGIMQWLGTRSYSIYLWHWPVVVALVYFQRLSEPLWAIAGIGLAVWLGHLSFGLVESPSRRRLSMMTFGRAVPLLLLVVVISALAAQQVRRHGMPERLPESIARVEGAHGDKNPLSKACLTVEDSCMYGDGPVRAILVGDSHADHLLAGLLANIPKGQGTVLFRGVAACFVAFGARSSVGNTRCDQLNQWLEENHRDLPAGAPMILAGIFSAYTNSGEASGKSANFYFVPEVRRFNEEYFTLFRERYVEMVCEVARERPVYLVRPTPIMPRDVPQAMGRAMLLHQQIPAISMSRERYRQQHAFVTGVQDEAVRRCGARVLDPLLLLCDERSCPGQRDGLPLYRDTSHLTERSSRLLAPLFAPVLSGAR